MLRPYCTLFVPPTKYAKTILYSVCTTNEICQVHVILCLYHQLNMLRPCYPLFVPLSDPDQLNMLRPYYPLFVPLSDPNQLKMLRLCYALQVFLSHLFLVPCSTMIYVKLVKSRRRVEDDELQYSRIYNVPNCHDNFYKIMLKSIISPLSVTRTAATRSNC